MKLWYIEWRGKEREREKKKLRKKLAKCHTSSIHTAT